MLSSPSSPAQPSHGKKSFLHVEDIDPRAKARWVQAAQAENKKLAHWVIEKLNAASKPLPELPRQ